MHNRMTSRRRHGDAPGTAREGITAPAQGEKQERAPRLPHERDESADSQRTGEPTAPRMGQAAREDIERGVVDTDTGPVLDQAYDKLREGSEDPAKKLSP